VDALRAGIRDYGLWVLRYSRHRRSGIRAAGDCPAGGGHRNDPRTRA